MIAGITLIATIVTIAILATPIQAYLNGTTNGDMLQTQDQERLRTQNRDCTQTQNQERQRTNECTKNRTCNQTMNMEQFRNQHRERTRNQGN